MKTIAVESDGGSARCYGNVNVPYQDADRYLA